MVAPAAWPVDLTQNNAIGNLRQKPDIWLLFFVGYFWLFLAIFAVFAVELGFGGLGFDRCWIMQLDQRLA